MINMFEFFDPALLTSFSIEITPALVSSNTGLMIVLADVKYTFN